MGGIKGEGESGGRGNVTGKQEYGQGTKKSGENREIGGR